VAIAVRLGTLAALACLVSPGLSRADTVGTAGAANTRSVGIPPGGNLRVIEIGTQVVSNEKIETSPTGSVQLLFIDKTTLSIGPSSSVVIDRFVFNPATAQGELSVTLGKGALRLVGGGATHTGGATITTPVAILGLRGGIVSVKHSRADGTEAILGFGSLSMTSGGVTQTLTRPGFLVQSLSAASPPSTPVKASPAQIEEANAAVTSKGGQHGGSTKQPTDQQAAANNIGTANSAAAPLLIASQAQNAARAYLTAGAVNQLARQGAQVTASVVTSGKELNSNGSPVVRLPTGSGQGAYAFVTTPDSKLGSNVPFLTASFAGSGGFSVSPVLGYSPGSSQNPGSLGSSGQGADSLPSGSNLMQAGLRVSGKGSAQSSAIFVMTSSVINDPSFGWTQSGGFLASSRLQANQTQLRAEGAVSSLPNSIQVDANGLPTGSFGNNQNRFDGPPVSQYVAQNAFTNAGSGTSYAFNQVSSQTTTPAGLGSDHPTAVLQAYLGGVMQTVRSSPASASGGTAGAPFAVNGAGAIFLDGASSTAGAVFAVGNVSGSSASAPGQFGEGFFLMGSTAAVNPSNPIAQDAATSAYVDRRNFAARSSDGGLGGILTSSVLDSDGNIYPLSGSVNGNTLRSGTFLVTANTVGANSAAFLSSISSTSVTPCQCDYTQWGFWSADTFRADAASNIGYSDKGHLMLWVAGIAANPTDIPTTGSATYTGHAVANISNNGSQYIAAGRFSNQVNFGTDIGQVQVAGLDGSTYGGVVNLLASSGVNGFAGTLNTGPSNRNMTMVGQFYQGGPGNSTPLYGEMGGTINITGPHNYLGGGVFVGRKP